MPTYTTHYNLAKPLVNDPTDQDLWGGELNNDMDLIDTALYVNAQAGVPTGTVLPFAGPTAPTGYLLCYGQAIDRTTYATLFGVIGTAYGIGNGTTTFNVPDARGRIEVGKDDMGGSAANRITTAVSGLDGLTLGASGGDQNVQTHTHTASSVVTDAGHLHFLAGDGGGGGGSGIQGTTAGGPLGGKNTNSATTGITVATTNANYGSGSSQNIQPSLIFNKIIKT